MTAESELSFGLPQVAKADKLTLSLALKGRDERTTYPLWVYPKADAEKAPEVTVVRDLATGERLMKEGKKVLCVLDKTMFPTNSVEGRFASDFWCYPMFRHICDSA